MKKLLCVLALVVGLVTATTSWAGATGYAGPKIWWAGGTGSSAYSSSWWRNAFNKSGGNDGTVTFIDNVSYSWHNTVRNTSEVTYTTWFSSQVKKAHCRANQSGFSGGCWVFN